MPVNIKKSRKDMPTVFTRVKNKLAPVFADSSQIHHVGSTAVPGLDGKNILDILISAKDIEHMNELPGVPTRRNWRGRYPYSPRGREY